MTKREVHDALLDELITIGEGLCAADRHELAVTRNLDDPWMLAFDAAKSRICKVVLDEAEPVFAFGANPVSRDIAVVWGFKTERGWSSILTVTKYIRKIMIPELRAIGIRRAACLVHPDNVRSQRWLTLLGFRSKATLRGFGPRRQEMLLFQRDEPDAHPS
jgi:hypothetical protein